MRDSPVYGWLTGLFCFGAIFYLFVILLNFISNPTETWQRIFGEFDDDSEEDRQAEEDTFHHDLF
jgi:hypothetical protein